mgnify:CR=1 FL=1
MAGHAAQSPRVTVVTRTRNRPVLLTRALQSVGAQSFQDLELVIVNDAGSTEAVDSALKSAPEWLKERTRVVTNETSHGREAALEDVRQELPHSLAVVVDEILDPDTDTTGSRIKGEGGRLQVRVSLVVERDSQKAIMIGRRGSRLKRIGTAARKGIEELVGRPVYLDLHVRTAKDWQSDPKALARLGF